MIALVPAKSDAAPDQAPEFGLRRKVMRVLALSFAVAVTALYARVCFGPINAKAGFIHLHASNPFKAAAIVVLSLQVWWLLTPQATAILRRWTGLTWWQVKLSVEALELCLVAIVGMVAADFQLRFENVLALLRPMFAVQLALVAIFVVALTSNQRWRRILALLSGFAALWRNWSWGPRIVCLALIAHLALVSKSLLGYWEQTSGEFLWHEPEHSMALNEKNQLVANFDYFSSHCAETIPADARVLYHGGNEGLILAFELYPRHVFMLPQEQREMFHHCWSNELWCRGMEADPLDAAWQWDPPEPSVNEQQFIADHGITHVVTFDRLNTSNCRIQPTR